MSLENLKMARERIFSCHYFYFWHWNTRNFAQALRQGGKRTYLWPPKEITERYGNSWHWQGRAQEVGSQGPEPEDGDWETAIDGG